MTEEARLTLKRRYMEAARSIYATNDLEFGDAAIDWQVDKVQLVSVPGEKYAWVRAWVRITQEELEIAESAGS